MTVIFYIIYLSDYPGLSMSMNVTWYSRTNVTKVRDFILLISGNPAKCWRIARSDSKEILP